MTKFSIRIADRTAEITALFESSRSFCQQYLCSGSPDFAITVTAADLDFERTKSAREDRLEGIPPRVFSDAYLETIAIQRKIAEKLIEYNTLLFHGSVVCVDGEGYLFTATSGTGKSTHTALWRQTFGDRAVMVNDDKPFLRITEKGVQVYGTPWNGKHGLGCNICVPLKAICILRRGEENRIRPVAPQDVLFMLLQQSNRPARPQWMPAYMELIDRLSANTSFYELLCNREPEAARIAYEGMSGKKAP